MANRYWVGGTGNWSDATNHWSDSSGGSPGASSPTSSDDVIIDSSSGFGSGGTITLNTTGEFKNLVCTSGHTYTITDNDEEWGFDVYGSLTFENGLTFHSAQGITIYSTGAGETITCGGSTLETSLSFSSSGNWTLQDDFAITDKFSIYGGGTFDANNHNVTASNFYFYAGTGYTPTIYMGSGTWEATGGGNSNVWDVDEYSSEVVTIMSETSTIKITGSNAWFKGGGKIYNNIWLSHTNNCVIGNSAIDNNTFNDFKIDAGKFVYFYAGNTQTVTTFTAIGSVGNLITLESYNSPTQFILSKSSGIVECDYLDISNSSATGGATWYAGSHSADTANNDGWLFESPPSTNVAYKQRLNLGLGGMLRL